MVLKRVDKRRLTDEWTTGKWTFTLTGDEHAEPGVRYGQVTWTETGMPLAGPVKIERHSDGGWRALPLADKVGYQHPHDALAAYAGWRRYQDKSEVKSEAKINHAPRLLKELSALKERYSRREISFTVWVQARRMLVREAEALGVTDKLLALMGQEQAKINNRWTDKDGVGFDVGSRVSWWAGSPRDYHAVVGTIDGCDSNGGVLRPFFKPDVGEASFPVSPGSVVVHTGETND